MPHNLWVAADGLGVALRDDTAVIQYRDMLTQAHNKAHVVFDEQNRDVEFIPHKTDGLHQFGSLIGVHTSRRLVQQQQLGIRCQRSGDLQLALLSVDRKSVV